MRQVNVPVENSVYDAAKIAAAKAGMLFRKWIERAISEQVDRETPAANHTRTLEPFAE